MENPLARWQDLKMGLPGELLEGVAGPMEQRFGNAVLMDTRVLKNDVASGSNTGDQRTDAPHFMSLDVPGAAGGPCGTGDTGYSYGTVVWGCAEWPLCPSPP